MSTLLRALSLGALCLCGIARGQFAPPGTGGSMDAGSTAASPAATNGDSGASLNIGLPPVSPRPDTRPGDDGPLAVVRADKTLTANAMIGFVNAEPIFLNDLFLPIDADMRQLASTSRSLGEFQDAVRTLITNQIQRRTTEIILAAATESQLTDNDRAMINAQMALAHSQLIAKHGGSVPAAERALAASGTTIDREMAELRREILRQLRVQRILEPQVVITRQMLLDAYDRDPQKWRQPAKVELFTITLAVSNWLRETTADGKSGAIMARPTPDQIQAAETRAMAQGRKIVEQLKAGADFATLAEDNESADGKRSAGGRWGMISRGSKRNQKEEDFIFSLPANSIGDPLLLHEEDFKNSSVVVAKVGQKTEARTIPFSEAQKQLTSDLRLAQLIELDRKEREKLERGAAIESVYRMTDVAVAAAVTRYAIK